MTKLVFATQRLDPDHPTLGAATAIVRALAARMDEVVVLALSGNADSLPANVRLRSFAAPTQLLRGARFESMLAAEIVRGRPVALLAHMSPVYALLAAPVLRPLRVPVLLWFTQQKGGAQLGRAAHVVDAILSVDPRSVPLASSKVHAIGHGIDTTMFECGDVDAPGGPLRLLSLGRYADVKGHDVVVRALASLPDAELIVRGEEATPNDARVRAQLAALVRELELGDRVQLLDAVPRTAVPRLLGETDVLVNATHGMSADKVVFEALAACVPVVAASAVFDTLLPFELRFADGNPDDLAARVRSAAELPAGERRRLRSLVQSRHSVEHWADEVVAAAQR